MPTLSFDQLVPGKSVTVTEDGYLYAVELVMAVTDKNRNDSGEVLRNLTEDLFRQDLFLTKKMPGKGNGKCKLVNFQNAVQLVMVLPGNVAKEYRQKFADIITRYFQGSASLVAEVRQNAASAAPINRLAREGGDASVAGIEGGSEVGQKRATEELGGMVALSGQLDASLRGAAGNIKVVTRYMRAQGKIRKTMLSFEDELEKGKQERELAFLRAKKELEESSRVSELTFQERMLELQARRAAFPASPPPVAETPAVDPSPQGYTTVLKTYQRHKAQFAAIRAPNVNRFLGLGGTKAREAYERQYGVAPGRVREGQYFVLSYPETSEVLIVDALRDAMRELTAANTNPITSHFVTVALPIQQAGAQ